MTTVGKKRRQNGGTGLVVQIVDALFERVVRKLVGIVANVVQQCRGDDFVGGPGILGKLAPCSICSDMVTCSPR